MSAGAEDLLKRCPLFRSGAVTVQTQTTERPIRPSKAILRKQKDSLLLSFVIASLAMASVAVASFPATATTHLFDQLPAAPQSCNTCHLGAPGSERNAFGLQVEAHLTGDGNTGTIDWVSLCALDADQDGSTNGAELGDPCCLFTMGNPPTAALTDPNNPLDISTNTCDPVDGGPGVILPPDWTCSAAQFDDDNCDCGCGAQDPACSSPAFSACDFNGCSDGIVDGIDPTQCLADASQSPWTCGFAAYADSETCDCGCGVPDPDCPSASLDACDANGCQPGTEVSPTDTTACIQSEAFVGARPGWWCPADWYAGEDGCDCGCGLIDPDCPRAPQLADCTQHGCAFSPLSEQTIPAAADIATCVEVTPPPPDWTCDPSWYSAQDGCDCGCGTPDGDCEQESIEYCASSGCADGQVVDTRDVTLCVSPDAEGNCSQVSRSSLSGLFAILVFLYWNRRGRSRRRQ